MKQCADCGSQVAPGSQWPWDRCAPCGESDARCAGTLWNPWTWASGLQVIEDDGEAD